MGNGSIYESFLQFLRAIIHLGMTILFMNFWCLSDLYCRFFITLAPYFPAQWFFSGRLRSVHHSICDARGQMILLELFGSLDGPFINLLL